MKRTPYYFIAYVGKTADGRRADGNYLVVSHLPDNILDLTVTQDMIAEAKDLTDVVVMNFKNVSGKMFDHHAHIFSGKTNASPGLQAV